MTIHGVKTQVRAELQNVEGVRMQSLQYMFGGPATTGR